MRYLTLLLCLITFPVAAQPVDVTFRYFTEASVSRVNVPGTFNGWNTNAGTMTWVDSLNQWIYTRTFTSGHQYKFFEGGNTWVTDPLNPESDPSSNNNSVLRIADPMVFQPAAERNADGLIYAVSAGVFGSQAFTEIRFEVNGMEQDGLSYFNTAIGVFRYVLPAPVAAGSQFKIAATDEGGNMVSAEIGEIQRQITWTTGSFTTVQDQVVVEAFLARANGTVDPELTEATLTVNGTVQTVPVTNGVLMETVDLELGANELLVEATIDGAPVASEVLELTRRLHPLDDVVVEEVAISGEALAFQVELTLIDGGFIPEFTLRWAFDEQHSTAGLVSGASSGPMNTLYNGTAEGPGELYFDVFATDTNAGPEEGELELRVAVIVEADGTARAMRYEETAAWINNAVVYEIFPLSFGPAANGTPANPGKKFQEITDELDYIADMGFNAIWFMPIMYNQVMDELSGGYNIVDFYNVDPTLGTNDDFKALVDRAHELGIRIILDLTPNHVSSTHPWINALRESGDASPPGSYVQNVPSPHNRGLDGRGANLSEIWQVEGGKNLYRKYDGFGDLANLDWDDDDLQAEILDVLDYWVKEFNIDGWRFDVYWGPWRRYGPERFGRPMRELMKRLRPDSWLLGEIAGTGSDTEVYYADDDNGTAVVGGLDAGYDWNLYHDAIRGSYGDIANYDQRAQNFGFWPGPNARYFRFLENHDESRIAEIQRSIPERILPLTGFVLTTTGIPMVYQGQEVNFGNVSGDGRRVSVDWNTERNGRFANYHQRLVHTRAQYPAFGTQELATIHTTDNVYAYVRPYLDENAVVVVNFASSERTITLDPSPHVEMSIDGPIPYTDLFADTTYATLGGFTVTVPAYETVVYITADDPGFVLPDLPQLPFGAVYTGVDGSDEVPETFRLEQNYPNPFNPVTTIAYALPAPGEVRLEVFDVLGRRVALLVDAFQSAGPHTTAFEAHHLPSGTYLYRLEAAGQVTTRTMVLVK